MNNALKFSTHGELVHLLNCAIADLEVILPEYDPSGDKQHPAWKTLDELKNMVKQLDTNTVLFAWGIEDVQSRRESLSDEQAREVLEVCWNEHDAERGMNWDTIDFNIDSMYGKDDDE